MLVKNGVRDIEYAFAMDRDERLAWLIVFGQLDGAEWDWNVMTWRPRK